MRPGRRARATQLAPPPTRWRPRWVQRPRDDSPVGRYPRRSINDIMNQGYWVCQRCQRRWNMDSFHCRTPACEALTVPALTPLGELQWLQMYADDVTLLAALAEDNREAEDATWPRGPEAELSPRSCDEPESEPTGL